MRTSDFHYDLPPDLIAQHPAPQRDASRLLVLHRADGRMEHRRFTDLPDYLRAGDVLVLNNSRVIRARLRGRKTGSGGEVEVLLVEEHSRNDWWVMLRPGKRVRAGTRIEFLPHPQPPFSAADRRVSVPTGLAAVVLAKNAEGLYRLQFEGPGDVRAALERFGEVPLPPYIVRASTPPAEDQERYQTVFADAPGSVAAPTAGLHFTATLLDQIQRMGVEACFVTLHVGLGTFAPVKAERLEDHLMHEEVYELPARTLAVVNRAKSQGRRILAVGTTSVRVLETVATQTPPRCAHTGVLGGAPGEGACEGRTRLFLKPPARFRVVDALLTNFHLPESTLLMLACAFAAPDALSGRELVLRAYTEAIRERYRFYSYGDAMLIL